MLNEVMAERGLTDLEAYVMVERIAGRSYGDIAGDAQLIALSDGGVAGRPRSSKPYTRQAVQLLEKRARAKMGLTVSV